MAASAELRRNKNVSQRGRRRRATAARRSDAAASTTCAPHASAASASATWKGRLETAVACLFSSGQSYLQSFTIYKPGAPPWVSVYTVGKRRGKGAGQPCTYYIRCLGWRRWVCTWQSTAHRCVVVPGVHGIKTAQFGLGEHERGGHDLLGYASRHVDDVSDCHEHGELK